MKESDAREQSLRRQLDGLQGKLAEAEARAAVAMSASSSSHMSMAAVAAHDKTIDDLKAQISDALQKMKQSEAKSNDLAKQLELAKTQAAARTAVDVPITIDREDSIPNEEAEARVRLAEAKAAKALAAARAAAAGLTVSAADLSAIESGLVVPQEETKRGTPWIAIMIAFAGGLGIMFLVWKFALSGGTQAVVKDTKDTPKADAPAPAPTQVAPKAEPAPAPPPTPAKPTATPDRRDADPGGHRRAQEADRHADRRAEGCCQRRAQGGHQGRARSGPQEAGARGREEGRARPRPRSGGQEGPAGRPGEEAHPHPGSGQEAADRRTLRHPSPGQAGSEEAGKAGRWDRRPVRRLSPDASHEDNPGGQLPGFFASGG